MNLNATRTYLQNFQFCELFILELGWNNPKSTEYQSFTIPSQETTFQAKPIAELSGIMVFLISSLEIPSARIRDKQQSAISSLYAENITIFCDDAQTKTCWRWVKSVDKKSVAREHIYLKGQTGDLFLSKLANLVVEFRDLEEAGGSLSLSNALTRLKNALDVSAVTKHFYDEYQDIHELLIDQMIQGISDYKDRRWYASILLNRLMFVWFMQKKFFIDGGDANYLCNKLVASKVVKSDRYYQDFLKPLFFEGFAKPEANRSLDVKNTIGKIPYLNGGLFMPCEIEVKYPHIDVPDKAFSKLFDLFAQFTWNLNDSPGGADNEINPDVLGYIFEQFINQKAFGAYYTCPEITDYLCDQTLDKIILDRVNKIFPANQHDSLAELLMHLDAPMCKALLDDILPTLSLLDPACGSGAFLVAALKALMEVYGAIFGRIEVLNAPDLQNRIKAIRREHPSLNYYMKKQIVTNNIYGVDLMPDAVETARLRLFLALISSAQNVNELEPLPNIEFNLLPGNSLIGLLDIKDIDDMFFGPAVKEIQNLISLYKNPDNIAFEGEGEQKKLRDKIETLIKEKEPILNEILLSRFAQSGGKNKNKFIATWNLQKKKEVAKEKRAITEQDIINLTPFHWYLRFPDILERGGFDAIITNPPWDIFMPNSKEFFQTFSNEITKNKMRVEDFNEKKSILLENDGVLSQEWYAYLSSFPHVAKYFIYALQYKHQISIVNGRTEGSRINLYKLFVEQCYNLLRKDGYCGMVVPSGIYSDIGCMQLRKMLFEQTTITGLFGFENRKKIFAGVDSRFKFVVLSYIKQGHTTRFSTAFMRHEVAELARFPREGAISLSISDIEKASPDSLSVPEIKCKEDWAIVEKSLQFPTLGEWENVKFSQGFNMTTDSYLFQNAPSENSLPLYEGKMIWQFETAYAKSRYWVDIDQGRKRVLGRKEDTGQILGYQTFRLAYRDIARNTDARTLITSIIPPLYAGNTLHLSVLGTLHDKLYQSSMLNSFIVDFLLRMSVTCHVSHFFLDQLRVPKLSEEDPLFLELAQSAARLVCTSDVFDPVAQEIFGQTAHDVGITDPQARIELRAIMDAKIAKLYGLTEDEFAYVLSTFPIVSDGIKIATMNAFKQLDA